MTAPHTHRARAAGSDGTTRRTGAAATHALDESPWRVRPTQQVAGSGDARAPANSASSTGSKRSCDISRSSTPYLRSRRLDAIDMTALQPAVEGMVRTKFGYGESNLSTQLNECTPPTRLAG